MKKIKNVPYSEIHFEFTRSSGAGGQHVNRTNTAAILRWNVVSTQAFSSEVKQRLLNKLEHKITNAGDLIIRSEESRDQEINKKRCFEKFEKILADALYVPKKRQNLLELQKKSVSKAKRIDPKSSEIEIRKYYKINLWPALKSPLS